MKTSQFAILAALLVVVALIQALPLIAPMRTAPRYEYFVKSIKDATFQEEIDKIGEQGWEAFFARRALSGEGADREAAYEIIFKRPK